MKAKIQTTIKEQSRSYLDTLRAIEDNLLATYGCLLPSGEVMVTLTKEGILGELKRQGKILTWKLAKNFEEGNNRWYLITLDVDEYER